MSNTVDTDSVSVIIPCLQERDYIGATLDSILANEWPTEQLEILVVDGGSADGTREIVRQYEADHPGTVQLLNNPDRITPVAMQIGLDAAKGEYVFLVGAHCIVAPNLIARSLLLLREHPDAACAGGYVRTEGTNAWGTAISHALSSPFGVGGAQFRLGNYKGYVDTLTFGAYSRKVLHEIGDIDTEFVRNQDDEMHLRLHRAGYKIYMDSDIESVYYARGDLRKLWRQFYQYGYWKVKVLRKHRIPATLRQLIPPGLVAALLGSTVLALWSPWPLAGLLTAYLVGVGLATLKAVQQYGLLHGWRYPIIFPCLHISYGLGYWRGLLEWVGIARPEDQTRISR